MEDIRNDSTASDIRGLPITCWISIRQPPIPSHTSCWAPTCRRRESGSCTAGSAIFDPLKRRAGLPDDVGALVEKLSADAATLTLVNTNPVDAREIVVQAGGYGEHRFDAVTIGGKTTVTMDWYSRSASIPAQARAWYSG